jgi:hypothetical protein
MLVKPKQKVKYNSTKCYICIQVVDLENGMNLDSAILGGLQEWMQYEVKMIAYNDAGNSSDSPITIERTRESG